MIFYKFPPYFRSLPHRQSFHLAWPMILSNISTPLMTLADSAMLGHHGSAIHLGAVAIGGNVIALSFWMFSFLRLGTTAVIGQALGANQPQKELLSVLQNSTVALGAGAIIIMLHSLCIPLAVSLMVSDAALKPLAIEYAALRSFAAPAVFLNYVLMGWFIGRQNTLVPLLVTVSANLLNILLDYWFIVHLNQGSAGAAKASLCAEVSACALAAVFAAPRFAHLITARGFRLKDIKEGWLGTAKLNSDLFVRTSILLLVFNFFTAQGESLGTTILAANALLMQLALAVSFALDGYAHAVESLVAHAVGKRNHDEILRACAATTFASLLIACGLSLIFFTGGNQLIALLTDQANTRAAAADYLIWLQILPLISVWCYMLDGVFIGAAQTQLMRNYMLVVTLGVFFPAWWLLQAWGNHGLWAAFVAFNLARGLSLGWAFYNITRRKSWI